LHVHWLEIEKGLKPLDLRPEDLVAVPGTNLRATPPVGSRVWLVMMWVSGTKEEDDKAKAVAKWLVNGRQRVDAQEFTLLSVVLFDRNAASSLPNDNRALKANE